jgi:hypothetical protein
VTPNTSTPNPITPAAVPTPVVPPPMPSSLVSPLPTALAPASGAAAPNPFPGAGSTAPRLPGRTSGTETPPGPPPEGPPPSEGSLPPAGSPGAEPLAPVSERATGKQNLSVSLEWRGESVAKVGVPEVYSLVVRNTCSLPVEKVLVNVRVPQGLTVAGTQPHAAVETNVLTWELGTLGPRQERVLQMKLLGSTRGDAAPKAWVTFAGAAVLRIHVSEPKLVLKVQAPDKVQTGDPFAFTLVATNPGDGSTNPIQI